MSQEKEKNNSTPVTSEQSWQDYELIDVGDLEKLERVGSYILRRPEPNALWRRAAPKEIWNQTDAQYQRSPSGGGRWRYTKSQINPFPLQFNNLTFRIQPTGFKHIGLFPEQAWQWSMIQKIITKQKTRMNILNLFAYTGAVTCAALAAGAAVTHVDSSKDIITWARENTQLSNLENKPVRWICDDALTFTKREEKRGNTYDVIILDPPKFGRGAKGQVWKIERDLPKLLDICNYLLSQKPGLILLNCYATDLSHITLRNLISDRITRKKKIVTSGELSIRSRYGIELPLGIWTIMQSRTEI